MVFLSPNTEKTKTINYSVIPLFKSNPVFEDWSGDWRGLEHGGRAMGTTSDRSENEAEKGRERRASIVDRRRRTSISMGLKADGVILIIEDVSRVKKALSTLTR